MENTRKQRRWIVPAIVLLAIIIDQVIKYLVKTNMSTNQILSLGLTAFKNKMYQYPIIQHSIPADGTWYDKNVSGVGASLVMNMEENQALLHNFLQEPQEVPEQTTN